MASPYIISKYINKNFAGQGAALLAGFGAEPQGFNVLIFRRTKW